MADPINPHDDFFRASMQNTLAAKVFFQHYLPVSVRDALDLNRFERQNSSAQRCPTCCAPVKISPETKPIMLRTKRSFVVFT
jgi:hypothetical protein